MTMRITVKNEDPSRTATIETIDVLTGEDFKPTGAPDVCAGTKDLAPGESSDFWIHSSRYVVVREKP